MYTSMLVGLTQNINNSNNNFKIKCYLSKKLLVTRVTRNIVSKLTTTSDISTFEVL